MAHPSAGHTQTPRQDWKHECLLSPTSAQAIPKVNVITAYMVTPNGFSFHGLTPSQSSLSWAEKSLVGYTLVKLAGPALKCFCLISVLLFVLESITPRAEAANRSVKPCTRTGSLQTGHLPPWGQHRCCLPAVCHVSSSSLLSYKWLNRSRSSCHNLQPGYEGILMLISGF